MVQWVQECQRRVIACALLENTPGCAKAAEGMLVLLLAAAVAVVQFTQWVQECCRCVVMRSPLTERTLRGPVG